MLKSQLVMSMYTNPVFEGVAPMQLLADESYMRLALQMAESTQGQTGINPVVGCVLVYDGRIVGMGAHLQRGQSHAEVQALRQAAELAQGSTAYVTLEPCDHQGLTGPCTEQLIQHGVRRVVIAMSDPNPIVAHQGIAKLRAAGIDVEVGVCEAEARILNEMFHKYVITKLPFVTAKTASTLDGRIASSSGDSQWITSELSRAYVHTLRHRHQGIMVGVGTVLADDPQLSVRLTVPAIQPVRIIVDSQLRIPRNARVLQEQDRQSTILLTTSRALRLHRAELEARGVQVLTCGDGPQVDLPLAMRLLGEREIGSILLEGGSRLNGAMLDQCLIDKLILFFAPKIIGGRSSPMSFDMIGYEHMHEAIAIERMSVNRIGPDLCITGYPRYTHERE